MLFQVLDLRKLFDLIFQCMRIITTYREKLHGQKDHARASSVNIFVREIFCPCILLSVIYLSTKVGKIERFHGQL